MPFVDEDRWSARDHTFWSGAGDFELAGVVEAVNGVSPSERRLGLTDRFGTLKGHGRQTAHELIEFRFNDPGPVLHETTIPNGRLSHYEMDAPYWSDRSLSSGRGMSDTLRPDGVRNCPVPAGRVQPSAAMAAS